ncbi:MAG: hypothetical protein JOY84_03250 [Curvibacter sp.]|nr:hypothetical protein [Curvibacter sp.]
MRDAAFDHLQDSLRQHQTGHLSLQQLLQHFRDAQGLLEQLPPNYAQVWHALLDRLESSALFDEESCSFSRQALLQQLGLWLDKARRQQS